MIFPILLLLTSADYFTRCDAVQMFDRPTPSAPQREFRQSRFRYGHKNQDNPETFNQNNKTYDGSESKYNAEDGTASIIDNYIGIGNRLDDDIVENVKAELIQSVCHNIRRRNLDSEPEYHLSDYACSFLSTNVYDALKARKLIDSLLNQSLLNSRNSGYDNSNGTTKVRTVRAADSGKTEHQPSGFYPHIYPYNDEAGITKLQHYDDSVHYIPHDQYPASYGEELPEKYVQVYPGAFQPQYSYSKIPRSYWMFAVFKGLFTIWEALQTLAILYLLWKVAFLTFVPGREETNTNILTQVWDDVSAILRPNFVETSESANQRQDTPNTPDLLRSDVTQGNGTDRLVEAVSAQIDQMSKQSEHQNGTDSRHSRMERAADEKTYFEVPRPLEINESKNYESENIEPLGNNSADLSEFIAVMRQEWRQHTNVDCTSCENLRTFNKKPDVPWTNNRIITTLMSHFLGPSVPPAAQHHLG